MTGKLFIYMYSFWKIKFDRYTNTLYINTHTHVFDLLKNDSLTFLTKTLLYMFLTPCNRDITEEQFDLYDNDATKHVLDFYNSDTCTAEHVFDLNNSDTTEYVFDLYHSDITDHVFDLYNSGTTEHLYDSVTVIPLNTCLIFLKILIGARLTSVRAARVWAM